MNDRIRNISAIVFSLAVVGIVIVILGQMLPEREPLATQQRVEKKEVVVDEDIHQTHKLEWEDFGKTSSGLYTYISTDSEGCTLYATLEVEDMEVYSRNCND